MRPLDLLVSWLRRLLGRPGAAAPALKGWARDWRRYARLNLDTLEARLPPGSLLGLTLLHDELGMSLDAPLPPAPAPEVGVVPAVTAPAPVAPDAAFVESGEMTAVLVATVAPALELPGDETADLAFLAGLFGDAEAAATSGWAAFEDETATSQTSPSAVPDISTGPTTGGTTSGRTTTGPGETDTAPVLSEGVAFLGVRNAAGELAETATNDTTPTLVGLGTPGAGIRVALSNGATALGTVADDGRWEATVASTLSDGAYTAVIDELGQGGDITSSTEVDIEVDTTPPTFTLSVDNDHVIVGDPTFHVAFGDATPGETYRIAFDIDRTRDGDFNDAGEAAATEVATVGGGEVAYTWHDFNKGTYHVRARVFDEAGNVGTSDPVLVYKAIPRMIGAGFSAPEETFPEGGGLEVEPGAGEPGGESGGESGGSGGGAIRPLTLGETEPNNSTGAANPITLNPADPTSVTGGIGSGTDLDFFSFTVGVRTGVFFDIDSRETGLSTTLNSFLQLHDSAGNAITGASNDNGYDFDTGLPAAANTVSATTADSALYRDLNPGSYFVRVSSVGNTTGNYVLNIRADTTYASTVPAFSSLPGALGTIYLDFDGHASTTDAWATGTGGTPYTAIPFDQDGTATTFSPGERETIRNIWRVMAEDYAPFNINVTTVQPTNLTQRASHHVITNSPSSLLGLPGGVLGVALLNSWNDASLINNVSFTFVPTFAGYASFGGGSSGDIVAIAHEMADTASHEVGHQLNLEHYANTPANAIMLDISNGLRRRIWQSGTNTDNVAQNDMAVIANTANGVGYRTDDHANNQAGATTLSAITTTVYGASGVIAQIGTDSDWFRFRGPATAGTVTVSALVNDYLNDLRPAVFLRDAAGNVIASSAGAASGTPNFDATVTATLGDQDYFVSVASAGGVGEAGQYDLIVTLPNPPTTPPTTPPPGGGGGGGGGTFSGDVYENNDTSAEATLRGSLLATQTYNGLTINVKDGLPDYDWFRWTAGATGTMTVTTTTTAGGDIELTLWRLDGNTLVPLSADTRTGVSVRSVGAAVTVGQTYLVQIKGSNPSPGVMHQASYNLSAVIA